MKSNLFVLSLLTAAAMSMFSCGGNSEEVTDAAEVAEGEEAVASVNDRAIYELNGDVKKVVKTTYYDVDLINEEYKIDSLGQNVIESTIYFDEDGKLKPRKDEVVRRDAKGRIVYWEDHRPNAKGQAVGYLKDTLSYKYVNGNHMVSDGMGNYSVIVYDDDNKVVGQYMVPRQNYSQNCSFNVYKKFDKNGNWTERVTIWSTQGKDASKPSVKYSIDRRDISYY